MKHGGLIPWNASVIFEMSKTSWQMGEHLVNGDLENHSKARSFRLAQWLTIIPSLRKTCRGSINLVRKFYLEWNLGHATFAGGIWKGDLLVADMEELELLDASEVHAKTQCKGTYCAEEW